MAISFPASPTNGQVYSPGGGAPDYFYNSTVGAWQANGASLAAKVVTGSLQLAFGGGAIVAAGTYALADEMPYPVSLTGLRYMVGTGGGSFTVAVNNAGTVVTGLSAVAVSSTTRATATPTGNLAVATGNRLEVVISSVTGAPTNAVLTLNFTRV